MDTVICYALPLWYCYCSISICLIFSSQHNFTWWDGAIFAFSIHLLFWYYFVFSFKSIQIIYVRVGVCVSNANFSFIISAAQILHEVRTMYLRQFCMQILFLLILIGLSLFFFIFWYNYLRVFFFWFGIK